MTTEKINVQELLKKLGAKPSTSEEHGLAQINDTDLVIFSPGISTAGFAEIRMAQINPQRKIIATTIDEKGLQFAEEVIAEVGLTDQIQTKLEDLRSGDYPPNTFNFIYARLVLHYLASSDLDKVLEKFSISLKPNGRLFAVVRSEKNLNRDDPNTKYDPETKLTTQPHYSASGEIEGTSTRYFHTVDSIKNHITKAGFHIDEITEYEEQLYKDFMRNEISPVKDTVIEVLASKL